MSRALNAKVGGYQIAGRTGYEPVPTGAGSYPARVRNIVCYAVGFNGPPQPPGAAAPPQGALNAKVGGYQTVRRTA